MEKKVNMDAQPLLFIIINNKYHILKYESK
jgi:hypothetical protein